MFLWPLLLLYHELHNTDLGCIKLESTKHKHGKFTFQGIFVNKPKEMQQTEPTTQEKHIPLLKLSLTVLVKTISVCKCTNLKITPRKRMLSKHRGMKTARRATRSKCQSRVDTTSAPWSAWFEFAALWLVERGNGLVDDSLLSTKIQFYISKELFLLGRHWKILNSS